MWPPQSDLRSGGQFDRSAAVRSIQQHFENVPGARTTFEQEDTQVSDIYLYRFEQKNQSRTEITTSLVFDVRSNMFRIRISQDYETQAKIERTYLEGSDLAAYLAEHPEHRDKARQSIDDHIAEHPEHKKAMKAAMAQMAYFGTAAR